MSGLTTIEEARKEFDESYEQEGNPIILKVMLKCWINHSESRNRNNNLPFTFSNYTNHLRSRSYLIEQVELGMINCDDIGGKEVTINYLLSNK